MTTEHRRLLRTLGIGRPRLHGDAAEDLWYLQNRRIKSLWSRQRCIRSLWNQQEHMGPSQGLIRLPVHLQRQFNRALNGVMLQAWENTSYLDYYDRQLWDLVEVMLQGDGNGRQSVSHTVSVHIHTMLRGREFARPTHTELVDVLELWSKIFQDKYSAFDQRVLCCLRSTFSDFLADQARYMQRGIDEGLKEHRAPDGFCEECPICAEEVQPGEYLTTLSPFCTHWFHSECIETWFEKSNDGNSTCPMCRTKIDVNW